VIFYFLQLRTLDMNTYQKLFTLFEEKIKADWNRQIHYTDKKGRPTKFRMSERSPKYLTADNLIPFKNIQRGKTPLASTIEEYIKSINAAGEMGDTGELIDQSTILRMINKGSKFNPRPKTLDVISRLLHYEGWDDFRAKNTTPTVTIQIPDTVANAAQQEPGTFSSTTEAAHENDPDTASGKIDGPEMPASQISNPWRPWALAALLLVIAVLGFVILFNRKSGRTTGKAGDAEEAAQIKLLINDAATAAFNAYSQLPDVDTAFLERCYYSEGAARLEFLRDYLGIKNKGYLLMTDYSGYSIVEFTEITKQAPDSYVVKTKEKWLLDWLQPDDSIRRYDPLNEQEYIVRKQGDSWKIVINEYSGKSRIVGHIGNRKRPTRRL
jgi:hypothetical protein